MKKIMRFVDASTIDTMASFSAAGDYVLRLTGDDSALTASDEVSINVTPAATTDETPSDPTSLTIQGEASDNAAAFTNATSSISSCPRTGAAVSWSPPTWISAGDSGSAQQTTDLASVIQEIVSRTGWVSGNSLAIIITGSGERVAEAYDGDQDAVPLLHVKYRLAAISNGTGSRSRLIGR